ncbi:hypothetical protein [Bosea sp. (in: a-proteobacteria)]|uniref:hypothetical protein n=1 Tax=Bosea sp. (in: a-proteobacteria) TaxID=1871050 RepID=UPI002626C5ED|nr:hypothetical protein [Bosea sp. (in: a-proteobacteria)]MCO5092098.1 hypothetical protein [Bosea sp. (in: a-proteobacteria)]
MGERIEDGGPAFPMLGNVAHNSDWLTEPGMSLRDWFAGQAMSRLLDTCRGDNFGVEFVDHVAEHSYRVSDAMLRARAKASPHV